MDIDLGIGTFYFVMWGKIWPTRETVIQRLMIFSISIACMTCLLHYQFKILLFQLKEWFDGRDNMQNHKKMENISAFWQSYAY